MSLNVVTDFTLLHEGGTVLHSDNQHMSHAFVMHSEQGIEGYALVHSLHELSFM